MNTSHYIISNTHWDREWRQTYQRHRMALVEMLDALMDILDTQPEYRAFHLDSQAVVLEDYLEIRPQQRERLEGFIREGRILVGPWFILPDEYFVGGENLVRNLLLGHRVARAHGRVSKIGYSPFSWGQISQLPQLYREFGIDLIMFYRGVNSLDSPHAEFVWEGADGTRALASRFSTMPRYNFYFGIYRPVVQGYEAAEVRHDILRPGQLLHPADLLQSGEDYHRQSVPSNYDPERIPEAVQALTDKQDSDFTSGRVIWMEGHDSSGASPETAQLIKDLQQRLPDLDIRHATLEEYRDALAESLDQDELPVVRGERRSAQYDHRSGNLYGYTLSARMDLKQLNFDVERWVQFYAEPLDTLAGLLGMDNNDRYLELAWRKLVENSAHDSIGGCSLDAVHEDGIQRYKAARELAQGIFRRGFEYLAKHVGGLDLTTQESALIVYNALGVQRSDPVDVVLDIPTEWDLGKLRLEDENGQEVSFQAMARFPVKPVLEQLTDRPLYIDAVRYWGLVAGTDISALGYKTLKVVPVVATEQEVEQPQTDPPVLENVHLRASWREDGRFDLLCKATGRTYTDLGVILSEGEAGHAWVHTADGPVYTTENAEPEIVMAMAGNLRSSVTVAWNLDLPADLETRQARERGTVMPIVCRYTLDADSPSLQVDIKVENTCKDHRLRFLLPTRLDASHSHGEGQFDVVARPIDRPDTSDWVEQPMYDYPMHHFVDVHNDQEGLAVLVDGLKEYEVLPDSEQTLAITLLRGFRHVVEPSSREDHSHETGSQCLGTQHFRLAILPHAGDWVAGDVYPSALRFNTPLRALQVSSLAGDLPPREGFLTIDDPQVILSAIKQAETGPGLVVRLYNPTPQSRTIRLRSHFELNGVERVTLEEVTIENLQSLDAHTVEIELESRQILTLKLDLKHA